MMFFKKGLEIWYLYLFPLTLKMRFASDHSLDIGFRDQSNNLEKVIGSILFRKKYHQK